MNRLGIGATESAAGAVAEAGAGSAGITVGQRDRLFAASGTRREWVRVEPVLRSEHLRRQRGGAAGESGGAGRTRRDRKVDRCQWSAVRLGKGAKGDRGRLKISEWLRQETLANVNSMHYRQVRRNGSSCNRKRTVFTAFQHRLVWFIPRTWQHEATGGEPEVEIRKN